VTVSGGVGSREAGLKNPPIGKVVTTVVKNTCSCPCPSPGSRGTSYCKTFRPNGVVADCAGRQHLSRIKKSSAFGTPHPERAKGGSSRRSMPKAQLRPCLRAILQRLRGVCRSRPTIRGRARICRQVERRGVKEGPELTFSRKTPPRGIVDLVIAPHRGIFFRGGHQRSTQPTVRGDACSVSFAEATRVGCVR